MSSEADTTERVDLSGIDLDKTLPSQTTRGECPREATWLFLRPCCGYRLTVCEEHRNGWLKGEAARTVPAVTCAKCFLCPSPESKWRRL